MLGELLEYGLLKLNSSSEGVVRTVGTSLVFNWTGELITILVTILAFNNGFQNGRLTGDEIASFRALQI